MKTRNISHAEYKDLEKSGRLIDTKHGYPAIILHSDKTITKVWAKKAKFFSSARFFPYAKRFISNAARLEQKGVAVPVLLEHLTIKGTPVHLVRYEELAGNSIRCLLKNAPSEVDMRGLAQFIFALHQQGIFFRAIHLGNVIQMPNGDFGLIDFTDVSFYSKPLSHQLRASNIATPLRYRSDLELIQEANLPNLLDLYLEFYELGPDDLQSFTQIVSKRVDRR